MKGVIILFLTVVSFGLTFAEKCPDVKFVENFDKKRFLGKWHGIQTTGKFFFSCSSVKLINFSILFQA